MDFFPFLTYVLVSTFTPGPNNILAMSNSMRFGYRRTQGLLLGMLAGFAIMLLVSGLLNVALARVIPQLHSWLNLAGAVYLVYLAAHIALSKPQDQSGPAPERLNTFAAGFALQFVNLKGILYGVTVFAMFITPVYQNPLVVGAVCGPAFRYRFRVDHKLGAGRQPVPPLSEQIRALVQSDYGSPADLHGSRQSVGEPRVGSVRRAEIRAGKPSPTLTAYRRQPAPRTTKFPRPRRILAD